MHTGGERFGSILVPSFHAAGGPVFSLPAPGNHLKLVEFISAKVGLILIAENTYIFK
jgi:hypothetical protein